MHSANDLRKEMVLELKKKVIDLSSQLLRLKRIYKSRIEQTLSKVSRLQYLGYDGMELVSSGYFFATINGFYIETYDVFDFFKDFDSFIKALGYDVSRVLFTLEEVLSFLDLFISSISDAMARAYFSMIRLAREKSIYTPDPVIKAILVREELYPTFYEIFRKFSEKTNQVDVRFLVAIFKHGFNMLIWNWVREQDLIGTKKKTSDSWLTIVEEEPTKKIVSPTWTIHGLYEEISAVYPIAYGDEIHYDILFSQVIVPIYETLLHISDRLIEEKKIEIKEIEVSGEILKKQEAVKEQMTLDGSMMRLNLEIAITTALHVVGDVTEQTKSEISRIVDSLLRQKMLSKFGNLYIKNKEKMIDLLLEDLYTIMDGEPYFILGILNYDEIRDFIGNPPLFLEKNRKRLRELLRRNFRAKVGANINYYTLSKGVVSLVEESVHRIKRIKKV